MMTTQPPVICDCGRRIYAETFPHGERCSVCAAFDERGPITSDDVLDAVDALAERG